MGNQTLCSSISTLSAVDTTLFFKKKILFLLLFSNQEAHVMWWAHTAGVVWYLRSPYSPPARAENPLPPESEPCVLVRVPRACESVCGGFARAGRRAVQRSEVGGDWSRGSPVRSDALCISDSRTRPRRGNIMATTTCTRFTDEYQLYEELGK